MKPRNREVNIFNMSVLDLLTGALGAFCFLTLALFPYYFKAQGASAKPSQAPSPGVNLGQLQAENDTLAQQIAAEKASGQQMPAFVLMSVGSYFTNTGNGCATVKLVGITPPSGAPSAGYRPTGTQTPDGRYYGYYLFLQRVGQYGIDIDAAPAQGGASSGECRVIVNVDGIANNSQEKVLTQQQTLHFDYQITGDDFPASLFD